jgi:hypothetical protein
MPALLLVSMLGCFGQEAPAEAMAGKWIRQLNGRNVTFTISSDLTYEVEFTGDKEPEVRGSYVISGTRVTFNDEGGEYAAKEVPGVYEFMMDDSSLSFKKINDPVNGRSMLVEGSWSRAGDEEE